MKRIASLLTAVVLVLSGATSLYASDAAATTSVKGWITDSNCGAKNANGSPESVKCVKDCVKGGAKLELISDGKTYQLTDQKVAMEHVGHEVVVTGTLDKDTIKVSKIEAADAKKKA